MRSSLPPSSALQVRQASLVLRQFRVVFSEVRHHFQEVEKHAGIGGAQVWALSVIQAKPGLGVQELAASMDIHQSTASNLVRQLIKRGLVVSTKSKVDGRAVCLTLEPAGEQMLAQAPGPHEGILPTALAQLPPDQLNSLHDSLSALLTVLQADETAAGIPLAEM